ncbi:MAG: succinate dehydrogenase assembly factor 2 [Xanthomonadales bacterium]
MRKLRWSCRRGMKELDVLLVRFIDANAADLARGAWPGLERLLALEDDVLWDLLQAPSAAGADGELIAAIRGLHVAET